MWIEIATIVLVIIAIALIIIFRPRRTNEVRELSQKIDDFQSGLKEDFRINRQENANLAKEGRTELSNSLKEFRQEMSDTLKAIIEQNGKALEQINKTLVEKIDGLITEVKGINKENREALKDFTIDQRGKMDELKNEQVQLRDKTIEQLEKISKRLEDKLTELSDRAKKDNGEMRESISNAFKGFQETFDKNVDSFNNLQKEKFAQMEDKQGKLIESTEKKLEEMRQTVDEKLQKTLHERLGQSFEIVSKQLESVQKGLGEMQTIAQDVGGLKKVLSNVRMRGSFGEVQLSMLLEQILAPGQYESNVRIKSDSAESVEFAVKLPGRDDNNSVVWLPIDAKFPKDVYEQLQTAHELGDLPQIDSSTRNLEMVIKKMGRDICSKYIDPPNTTDFAIMFLPFEGIFAEVVRKASLLEDLQRECKVIVTGPTTLAAILNSLQMGFKTLAIQKRSGEVWRILGAVKKEFENFGGLLEKAQKNIQTASNQIDEVMGKRTRAIQRKLKGVEVVSESEAQLLLPEISNSEIIDEEEIKEE